MKSYATDWIRNVGIVGHGDTGKTQLVSSLLYTAGMTPRLGKVADGSTTTDWDEEEIARKISINTGLAYAEWQVPGQPEKTKINLLDTPGYSTFINETKSSLIAADASLILVDAAAGVQVVTEKVWDYATEYDQPRAFVINWMDRELASFDRALASIEQVFGRGVVPIQLPIGSEKNFRGVIDLVSMKALIYTPDGDGKAKIEEIPAEFAEEAKAAHERLVELVAEGEDELMQEFFDKGTLPVEDLKKGLHEEVRDKKVFPVLLSSALHNIGSDAILNFIVEILPSPAFRGKATGYKTPDLKGETVERKIASSEPLSVFVFKTVADPFAGRINYFKVMSGVLKNDATLQNFNRGSAERFQHIQVMQGKTATEVPESASRRYRHGRKTQGNHHGRDPGRQECADFFPARAHSRAFNHVRRRAENARRRRPHRRGDSQDSRGGSRAALRPRPADQGIPALGRRAAAHRGRRRQTAQALSRRNDAEASESSLPRDDSRQSRRRGQTQKADRRPRAVRPLPDQDGAAAARQRGRVRGRRLRRRDSQELDSVGRKRHPRFRRARLSRRLSRSSISA